MVVESYSHRHTVLIFPRALLFMNFYEKKSLKTCLCSEKFVTLHSVLWLILESPLEDALGGDMRPAIGATRHIIL